MSADSVLVASLVEFYSAEEIRGFWQTVFQARMARVTKVVAITSHSADGATASGMVLNSPQEMDSFIAACRQAIANLGDDGTTLPESLGSSVDFSGHPVGA